MGISPGPRLNWPRIGERTRILGRLEALLLAMDRDHIFIISGTGDVIEPDESVAAIGSGGPLCLALRAHALVPAPF